MEDLKNAKITIATAIVAGIFIIGVAVKLDNRVQEAKVKSEHCLEKWQTNANDIEELQKMTRERENQYIEIKTKLEGIEVTLVEIKKSLK